MDSITNEEDVLRLARLKRTDPKLKKIAKAWNLDYIQIYREWYPLGCSRDFLIPLVELSRLIGEYAEARQTTTFTHITAPNQSPPTPNSAAPMAPGLALFLC
jgi:hypothetical protein